ncbi:hypothetical protein LO762_31590 [Actinocorallia sp. API 0066]|uniref:hypothetical protein n=1 Tax=Actinocorallia sp. API 0066 TaxID=2896846 RepID=UPI001E32AAEF|nr:hypothetical protein [Actinocorallia sp. API 0066]MCD0453696.1 hypothetical protein [Actinocorallia sp. API 0066]
MSEPLTARETERFVAAMVPVVAEKITSAGRFRITAWTPAEQAMYREVTSRAAETLGRPLMSYGNGRDLWIVPAEAGDPIAPLTP